jgi:putative pyruvate formate lyase activating enzyme
MSDLTRLTVWDDPAIRGALSWYLDVAENRRPAKFRIAATVATKLDPAASGEDALWAELDRLTPIFLARWEAIRAGQRLPPAVEGPSLLELCRELAYRMLGHCNFCPWDCRVDRVAGRPPKLHNPRKIKHFGLHFRRRQQKLVQSSR